MYGEEFLLAVTGLTEDGARALAENVVAGVRDTQFPGLGLPGPVTCSLGVVWGIPEPGMTAESVAQAVNLHQSANPGDGEDATIARILNAADGIARLLCEVPGGEDIAKTCLQATEFVGIDVSVLVKLLPTIESDIEELADALRIDVIASNVYALVAQTIQEKLSVASVG